MEKPMLCFDVDGTLRDNVNHQVSDSTLKSLHILKESGYKLIISSGRGVDVYKRQESYMAQNLKFIVTDPVGLYATPTTELVNAVKQFHSDVSLRYGNKEVNLKSMMGVLSLGIPTKAQLEIIADGGDEKQAIEEIKAKINELGISTIE